MKHIQKNKLVLLVLLIASVLRLYQLGSFPLHLTPDEAALGYNAYSILETGRDEYGELLPLVFKSFGDYKPGLYVYLTVPFVWSLGLNEWAVRLPSALMGVLAVWTIYQITKFVFVRHSEFISESKGKILKQVQDDALRVQDDKTRVREDEAMIQNDEIPLFCSLVLALSPWHIQFSRGAWEANVALSLVLLGIYFFLKSLSNRGNYMLLSSVFFGLTLWTYQGAKLSTVLVLIALVFVYGKKIYEKFSFKSIGLSILTLGIIAAPIALGLFAGETGGRLQVKSIFSYNRPQEYVAKNILQPANIEQDSIIYLLFHSELLNTLRGIGERYFYHFSGRFLVFEGDWGHPHLTPPYIGEIYWSDVIALVVGIFFLTKIKTNFRWFVFIWLTLAPLPSALTLDQINSVRSLNMVAPLAILIGLGWYQIFTILTSYLNKRTWIPACAGMIIIGGFLLFQLIYYLDSYYIMAPQKNIKFSQGYGYKQIVQDLTVERQKNKKIIVQQSYDQPYIYFLFYEKFDPQTYQQTAQLKKNQFGDVGLVEKIGGNLEFRDYSWNAEKNIIGNIYVGPANILPLAESSDVKKFKIISDVKYPNQEHAFRVVEILN